MPAEPHTPSRSKRLAAKPYDQAPNTSSTAPDDDVRTPSSPSSDGDSADEYRPPSPSPFVIKNYHADADLDELMMVSDDDVEDIKPVIQGTGKKPPQGTGAAGRKGGGMGTAKTPKTPTPKKATGQASGSGSSNGGSGSGSGSGSGGKLGTPWTPEETWVLFQHLYPRAKADWAAAARAVGRDPKSCQNRSAVLQKKLEVAIKAMV